MAGDVQAEEFLLPVEQVARADWPTVPVAIFRFLGWPGADNVGTAMALCVVLMGLVAATALVSERALARRAGP